MKNKESQIMAVGIIRRADARRPACAKLKLRRRQAGWPARRPAIVRVIDFIHCRRSAMDRKQKYNLRLTPPVRFQSFRAIIPPERCRQRPDLESKRYSVGPWRNRRVFVMSRPQSTAEVARRAISRKQEFDPACREFLDAWQSMDADGRVAALADEPAAVGQVQDAYLAALAEHFALSERIAVPSWTEEPHRFLTDPFFSGGLERLKAILLVESPLAFRRRLIFISADGLSRPHRRFVEDNALNAALDV
jgi:hypothetical protein